MPFVKAQQQATAGNADGNAAAAMAEHSPVASTSTHNHSGINPQAFSIFANVNIPERNGAIWPMSSQQQASSSNAAAAKSDEQQHFEVNNGEVNMAAKQSTATSPMAIARDAAVEINDWHTTQLAATAACIMDAAIEPTEAASQSPLLKLLSPRHDKHSAKNRSPFQNTLPPSMLPPNKFGSQTASNFR